jgi:hypothetical protein
MKTATFYPKLTVTEKEAILKCGNIQKRLPLTPEYKHKGEQECITIGHNSELWIFWDLLPDCMASVYIWDNTTEEEGRTIYNADKEIELTFKPIKTVNR